jgi:glycosyltransferase involved in cell wall biosynthesis
MNRSLPTPLEEPVGATFHRYEGMISVAIPVANGEPFLKACLASIVSQTHENMEIVIGENCSTDRTLEIIESFADPRIRVLSIPKSRLPINENWERTVAAVRGEFVKIVAHDDGMKPWCLARQAGLLSAEPRASLVAGRRTIIDAHDRVVIRARGLGSLRRKGTPRLVEAGEIIRACARAGTNLLGEPASVLFRREFLPEPLLDKQWNFEGDLDLYFRCLEKGPAILDEDVSAFFRASPQQISAKFVSVQISEIEHFFHTMGERYPGTIGSADYLAMKANAIKLAWMRRAVYTYQRMLYR